MRKVRNLTKRQKSLKSIKSIPDVENTKKMQFSLQLRAQNQNKTSRRKNLGDRQKLEIIQLEEIKEKE